MAAGRSARSRPKKKAVNAWHPTAFPCRSGHTCASARIGADRWTLDGQVCEHGVRMGLFDALTGSVGVGVGDVAPDFALPDAAGRTVRLGDYREKKAVGLYFYPKDDTPGCTKEACTFRDQYQDFVDAGAEVIGVSSDSAASHGKFAAKHTLPFVLLSDRGGTVRKQYGVPATLGLLPGRVTFVIDRHGIVRHVFNSQLQATRHVSEALGALRAPENR